MKIEISDSVSYSPPRGWVELPASPTELIHPHWLAWALAFNKASDDSEEEIAAIKAMQDSPPQSCERDRLPFPLNIIFDELTKFPLYDRGALKVFGNGTLQGWLYLFVPTTTADDTSALMLDWAGTESGGGVLGDNEEVVYFCIEEENGYIGGNGEFFVWTHGNVIVYARTVEDVEAAWRAASGVKIRGSRFNLLQTMLSES